MNIVLILPTSIYNSELSQRDIITNFTVPEDEKKKCCRRIIQDIGN